MPLGVPHLGSPWLLVDNNDTNIHLTSRSLHQSLHSQVTNEHNNVVEKPIHHVYQQY